MVLKDQPTFAVLERHYKELSSFHLRQVLPDQARYQALCVTCEEALFDFSKHLVTTETMAHLMALARARDVADWRDRMFAGSPVNSTENRAALHVALRAADNADIRVDGVNVMEGIKAMKARLSAFADEVRRNKNITDVINIGIGGSDLGPRFVTEALQEAHDGPRIHFVSNVDGHVISRVLAGLNPQNTLVMVASKTFTTEETMLNAHVARDWLAAALGDDKVGAHLAAMTTANDKAKTFGVPDDRVFGFADWVGGRYSLWSSIGLPIMLAVGPQNFERLLAGARAMDEHFKTAPLEKNIPVLMAMLGVWYRNLWEYPAHLLLPYDQRLARLAKFIQQMDMESNGKSVDRDGRALAMPAGPVIFGEPGTDSQHSFMQLVHQGMIVPADFVAVKKPDHALADNHLSLLSHCFAQSRALAVGQTLEEAGGDPHRVFSGNRPSTTILLPQLDAYYLGMLLAAYEHKVFVQGIVWGVNSFDQPGVELGKKLAATIAPALRAGQTQGLDPSTAQLIKLAR